MKKIYLIFAIILLQFLLALPAIADYHGTVVASENNNTFVISTMRDNETFVAKTLCYDVQEGDNVLFSLSIRTCTSNRFVNLRNGQSCEVWCESNR